MRHWVAFAAGPVACALALSCASTDGDGVRTAADSGADVASPPPPVSSDDAGGDVQLPDGGRPKPLAVACKGDPCYVAVSGNGGHHMCGLLHDGTVRCWGRDSLEAPAEGDEGGAGDGALGRGVAVSLLEGATPAPVVGLASVTQISVGPNLGTCARTSDGAVYCWGRNEDGQLGRPPTEAALPTPTRVEGLPPVREVQLGHRLGCAIGAADGGLYCWGTFGEDPAFEWSAHGVDASPMTSFSPQVVTTIRGPLTSLAIATGGFVAADTIVALRDDHVLATVGSYVTGETSLGAPWQAPLERPSVHASWPYAYLTSDGLLWQWSPPNDVSFQKRALVPSSEQVVDAKVSLSLKIDAISGDFREVAQGGALLSTGRLFRWGPNTAGGLGLAPSAQPNAEHPIEIRQLGRQVVSFATTTGAACASLVDGTVKCWGANTFGELGRGSVDLEPHPEAQVIR
jgi:Regulator of chromosome condensation (RCC1) repeat